jgi:hypothetical protein
VIVALLLHVWATYAGEPAWTQFTFRGITETSYECCERVNQQWTVRAPWNAWSSIAFFWPAGWLAARCIRFRAHPLSLFMMMGNCLLLCTLGFTSFFNHASITVEVQQLNLKSILVLLVYGIAAFLTPLIAGRKFAVTSLWIGFVVPAIGAILSGVLDNRYHIIFPLLYAALITAVSVVAVYGSPKARPYCLCGVFLSLFSMGAKLLDDRTMGTMQFCTPDTPFQITAVFFNCLNAVVIYFIGKALHAEVDDMVGARENFVHLVDEGWIDAYRKLRDANENKLPFWAPAALLFWVNVLMLSLTIFAPAVAMLVITVYVGILLLVYKIPLVYGTFRGLRHWTQNAKRDYRQELLDARGDIGIAEWDETCHFVVIANYKEELETIAGALESIARSSIARSNIGIMLAMEAREPGCREKAEAITARFRERFRWVTASYHPDARTLGESPGKASNVRWAEQEVLYFAKREGLPVESVIVTIADADSEFHPRYFEAVSYGFLMQPSTVVGDDAAEPALPEGRLEAQRLAEFWASQDDFGKAAGFKLLASMQREAWRSAARGGRHWTVFQPPIAHMKNYVRQPPIVQQSTLITLCHELGFLGSGITGSMPFSTYSLSLALLVFVGRHDSEWISEDWHLFEKAALLSLGKAEVQPVLLPLVNTAPEAETPWQSVVGRWEQAKRHTLGFSELTYLLGRFSTASSLAEAAPAHAKPAVERRFLRGWCVLIWKVLRIHGIFGTFATWTAQNMWLLYYWTRLAPVDDSGAMSYIIQCDMLVVFIDSVCYALLLFNAFRARYHSEIAPRIDRETHWFWAFVDRHPLIHYVILTAQSMYTGPVVVWCAASAVWISSLRIRHGPPFEYVLALKPTTEQKVKPETAVRLLDR